MTKAAVFGVPRSGTTWLGELMNSHPELIYRYQPLFSYEFKSALNEGSTNSEVETFYERIQVASSDFVLRDSGFHKLDRPTGILFKEVRYLHLIPMLLGAGVRIVFIRRNPVDVLNSWYKAPREFDPSWDIEDEWLDAPKKNMGKTEEFYGLTGWLRAQEILASISSDLRGLLHVLEYEDLREKPEEILPLVFDFLDLKFHDQSRAFLKETTTVHKDGVYDVHRTKPTLRLLPEKIAAMILARSEVQEYMETLAGGRSA